MVEARKRSSRTFLTTTRDITTINTEQITPEAIQTMLSNDARLPVLEDQRKIRVDQSRISPIRNKEIPMTKIPKKFLKIKFFTC
jgi:CBS domain-containing protein